MRLRKTRVLTAFLLAAVLAINSIIPVSAVTVEKTGVLSSAYSIKATVTYNATTVNSTQIRYVLQGIGTGSSSMGMMYLIDVTISYKMDSRGIQSYTEPYNYSDPKWNKDDEGPWTAYYNIGAYVRPVGGKCDVYYGRSEDALTKYISAEY